LKRVAALVLVLALVLVPTRSPCPGTVKGMFRSPFSWFSILHPALLTFAPSLTLRVFFLLSLASSVFASFVAIAVIAVATY
jgi:hypothetical protein